jgi:hypothetical protein
MKKILLIALISASSSLSLFSQKEKCATDKVLGAYLENDKGLAGRMKANEVLVKDWIRNHKDQVAAAKTSNVLVKIPVVFHVVYKNTTQNIADSNIFRQIDILNECYRLQNTNFTTTRPEFDTIAADVNIEFCLALLDPQGNPTNGIVRKSAPSNAAFDPLFNMDKVKSSATNGDDPWPTTDYLNIWVCDMSIFNLTIVLGYATFPGSDPMKDGVVIQYNFIGYQSNGTTNNLGRTTVHEVGHWLGMRHIWGDGQQSSALCDSTDYVDDTPNADSASQQTCMSKNTCNNESPYWNAAGIDPPDMIENYMDYSYDACMTMFTEGQKARMHGFLNTLRAGLFVSPGGCNVNSIKNEVLEQQVKIFPNPASNELNIAFEGSVGKNRFSCELYNALGELVLFKELNAMNNKIAVRGLAKGLYFIKLNNGPDSVIKKIVLSE